jgi:hypothetical protein
LIPRRGCDKGLEILDEVIRPGAESTSLWGHGLSGPVRDDRQGRGMNEHEADKDAHVRAVDKTDTLSQGGMT